MLQYLVKSPSRRMLLELMFVEGASGSMSALAEKAGVGFASAHRELSEMRRFGLVETSLENGRVVFRPNLEHPQAALLKELVVASHRPPAVRPSDTREVRARLRALGAPLQGDEVTTTALDLHATLVDG